MILLNRYPPLAVSRLSLIQGRPNPGAFLFALCKPCSDGRNSLGMLRFAQPAVRGIMALGTLYFAQPTIMKA